jgi:hypothetical protein
MKDLRDMNDLAMKWFVFPSSCPVVSLGVRGFETLESLAKEKSNRRLSIGVFYLHVWAKMR